MKALKKILVFDDNKDILDLLTYLLEDAGYEITTSDTAENIEEQVANYMPNLILMDNWLPGPGGLEATKIIKNNVSLKHIPVVYFSANNNIAALAKEAGAESYLAKPFDINTLEDIIKKTIG